jgi:hypothetical protein
LDAMEERTSLSHDEWLRHGPCVFVKLCCLSTFVCRTSCMLVSMVNHAMLVELCNA